jgi:diguanylate cyclase (GGDEF)-like protein
MADLSNKNILICSNLKSERVLLFNYFDAHESEMIYSAKDINGCVDILAEEEIDYLVIEYSESLINTPEQLIKLVGHYVHLQVVLLCDSHIEINNENFLKLKDIADVIIFAPLSALEIELKLTNLQKPKLYNKSSTTQEISESSISEASSEEGSKEVWDTFFTNSLQSKLIVRASDQKIMFVNEALIDLVKQKKSSLIGKSWSTIDNKSNFDKYVEYIKEINSNEKVQFIINYKQAGLINNFKAEYEMSVYDGEIVYIGQLRPENIQGVSNEVFTILNKIEKTNVFDDSFTDALTAIRESIQFNFLMFFEYQNKKLLKPFISGDMLFVKQFLTRSMGSLLSSIKKGEEIEINKSNKLNHEYSDILDNNDLQSLCIYPITHQSKIYGSIVAGSHNQHDNWHTVSVLLKSLSNKCRFNLFQKTIINQREKAGLIDALTGLPNRNSMTTKFADYIKEGISSDKYLSLMIIDISKLNFYNKNIGIELTDEIIVNISQIIVHSIKNVGEVYRLSGDEFMVLLHPHKDKGLIEKKAVDLVDKLDTQILLSNGEEVEVNYNIGVSIFPDDGQTVSSMMKNADLALYDAKLADKNNYMIFKYSETGQALKQKTEMEENLKKAIEENHIKVFFQPKIDSQSEDVIGFEALVRWVDPVIGMINPGQFIPLAEETGLINEIGEFVAKRSCELVIEWQKRYGLSLTCSINLSAVQLIDSELPKKLERIINTTGVHPHFIDFEITETISLDVVPNLVQSLNEIVAIGCTLSIDDFGTGHSSLDYIKKIPAKFIKIDQSFVCNIGLNPEDEAILDATINIAQRLNRKIVAEGVETEEQREYLLNRGCEYFQGFLFSRPLPEEQIEKLLQQRVKLMGST